MFRTMRHGIMGLLAAAGLLAIAPCWTGCGSNGGGDDPAGNPNPPPPLPTSTVGWTEFTASLDTRTVHVSSSTGNDANDGLTPATAKATISAGKGLLRNGFPDWLLLKAGDTWTNQDFGNWTKSGRSHTEPMLVSSYGTGARPWVRTGNNDGFTFFGATPVNHVAIVGIHLEAHTYTGTEGCRGVFLLVDADDILFEDCYIEGYADNLAIQGNQTNVAIRRCVIVDSYSTNSHSQGIYVETLDGLLIEECVFDHNGWKEGVAGAEEVVFNHNIYIQSDAHNVIVRGNISARASSHGLQLRPGGKAENNLFLRNAIAMFAAGEGSGPQTRVTDNVVLDAKDIDGSARGAGMEIFDSQDCYSANNIVAHKPPGVGDGHAFSLEGAHDDDPMAPYVLTFESNITYKWNGRSLDLYDSYTGLTVRNNLFQDVSLAQELIDVSTIHGFEVFQNNTYFSTKAANSWFQVGGSSQGISGWVATSGETGALSQQVAFPDPDRTIATYQASLGATATLDAFLAEARLQGKGNWRPAYTADGVNDYIRAGFGR